MNVLSLCDGMSCGQMALEKLGIKVDSYFASEIKSHAIKLTQHNFPNTIQIGDVNKVSYKNGRLYTESGSYPIRIDLVMFGSPCQSFSRAMITKRKIGLEDKQRSGLFLECYRILKEVKPRYFLMENVVMDEENKNVISDLLGVQPVRINGSLVSAQMRDRLYWTNVPDVTVPEDRGIEVSDILDTGYYPYKKSRCLLASDENGYYIGSGRVPIKGFIRVFLKCFGTYIAPNKEYFDNCMKIVKGIQGKQKYSAKLFDSYNGHDFDEMRYLTKYERARLQTVPEKYVETLTEKEAANLLGDGWTVDVIVHILKGLKEE